MGGKKKKHHLGFHELLTTTIMMTRLYCVILRCIEKQKDLGAVQVHRV
jgi:hypothetical protein